MHDKFINRVNSLVLLLFLALGLYWLGSEIYRGLELGNPAFVRIGKALAGELK